DVGKIHRQRISCFLSDLERHGWRGRCEDDVHLLECFLKISEHQRTDFQSLQVVRIVVSSTQSISAQQYPTLDFFAESVMARSAIHLLETGVAGLAQTVAHAIVAGKI